MKAAPLPAQEEVSAAVIAGPSRHELTREFEIERVLNVLDSYRRTPSGLPCSWENREQYGQRLLEITRDGSPLRFLLPGFSFKSPNPEFVLGPAVDGGERKALENLNRMMAEISSVYPSGSELLLLCDGSVFNDLFGVADRTVKDYNDGVKECARCHPFIKVLNLADVFPGANTFAERRAALFDQYGQPEEAVRARVENDPAAAQLLSVFKKYVETEIAQVWRKEGIQGADLEKKIGDTAMEILRRDQAYNNMLADKFPLNPRMVVHPYAPPDRLPINLISSADGSETPWYNVLIQRRSGELSLMTRRQAESAGLHLEYDETGKPSHYLEP